MGKEIINRVIKNKTVGKSGLSDSGRVTIDAKELHEPLMKNQKVDIDVRITVHDDNELVQEIRK